MKTDERELWRNKVVELATELDVYTFALTTLKANPWMTTEQAVERARYDIAQDSQEPDKMLVKDSAGFVNITGTVSERLEVLTYLVDPENQPHQGYPLTEWSKLIEDTKVLECKAARDE